MAGGLIGDLSGARVESYRNAIAIERGCPVNSVADRSIESLYIWQASVASAWYETISLFEPILRNRIDMELRKWNRAQGKSEDWLEDAVSPLNGLVAKMASNARKGAQREAARRPKMHARHGNAVTLDDRVAQLSFGNLCSLFPMDPPKNRAKYKSGFSARENLWIHALDHTFAGLNPALASMWRARSSFQVPTALENGYAVGSALESLRRLRNRVSHQEQLLWVDHMTRLTELYGLTAAIAPDSVQTLRRLNRLDRQLALRPRF